MGLHRPTMRRGARRGTSEAAAGTGHTSAAMSAAQPPESQMAEPQMAEVPRGRSSPVDESPAPVALAGAALAGHRRSRARHHRDHPGGGRGGRRAAGGLGRGADGRAGGARRGAAHRAAAGHAQPGRVAAQGAAAGDVDPARAGGDRARKVARAGVVRVATCRRTGAHFVTTYHGTLRGEPAVQAGVQLGDGAGRDRHRRQSVHCRTDQGAARCAGETNLRDPARGGPDAVRPPTRSRTSGWRGCRAPGACRTARRPWCCRGG